MESMKVWIKIVTVFSCGFHEFQLFLWISDLKNDKDGTVLMELKACMNNTEMRTEFYQSKMDPEKHKESWNYGTDFAVVVHRLTWLCVLTDLRGYIWGLWAELTGKVETW